jgi:thiol:disulfide interchange protein
MKTIRFVALAIAFVLTTAVARPIGADIYPAPDQARADIAAALKTAATTHKRVLLDFGGNWCGDCQVLNIYFHDSTNWPILQANFVLVDVNVGRFDANVDLAEKYGIPLKKGVPALAVVSSRGKLLYSQTGGEFENMRHMESSALTKFLIQWKPVKPGCSVTMTTC